MAIAFNLPSEREASEENFSRLNRLLTELYEVLCHILVARQPEANPPRDRPFSESDIARPSPPPLPARRSASSPPLTLTFDTELDDDVFISPRDSTNDPFSIRPLEIFGYSSPRTPAGVLLSPRRERKFTFSVPNEKHWRDKGGTEMDDEREMEDVVDTDVIDSPSPEPPSKTRSSSESSILSSILPDKVSGSICTAVLVVLGWKYLLNKR